jgi:hypothetical protein
MAIFPVGAVTRLQDLHLLDAYTEDTSSGLFISCVHHNAEFLIGSQMLQVTVKNCGSVLAAS